MGGKRIEITDSVNSGGIGGTENGNSGGAGGIGAGDASGKPVTGTAGATIAGTAGATIAGTAGATGTGIKKAGDNAPVKPASIAPDEIERDDTGAAILKADGSPRKKRGRKPGQQYAGASEKAAPKAAKTDRAVMATEMLAAQFQILNTGIAFVTRFPDWELDDSEAIQMASASANVMAQFDYVPDPKIAAILGLVTTTSMIYGPRLYLYRQHINKARTVKSERKIAAADEQAAGTASNGGGDGFALNLGQFNG